MSRSPRKSREIYQWLKDRIANGELPPDSMLPYERELAEQAGVARDTLRAALSELEKDGLLRRVRGQGTFVASLHKPVTVSYLLPCADFDARVDISSRHTHHEMIFGLMQQAGLHNCKLETIPLTFSNQSRDINWRLIEDFNEDTRVVMVGPWFKEIFPFLRERRCRVAIISTKQDDTDEYFQQWQWYEVSFEERLKLLCAELKKRGYENIFISKVKGNLESVRREIAGREFEILILDQGIIRDLSPDLSINENLGLPPEIPVVPADRNCFPDMMIRKQLSAFFPYEQTAREILPRLLESRYTPYHRHVAAFIQEASL